MRKFGVIFLLLVAVSIANADSPVSPNTLFFSMTCEGTPYLYALDMDAGTTARVLNQPAYPVGHYEDDLVVFLPDGGDGAADAPGFYALNLDTMNLRLLVRENSNAIRAQVGGDKIVYWFDASITGRLYVAVIGAEGRLLDITSPAGMPMSLSPDGSQLVYAPDIYNASLVDLSLATVSSSNLTILGDVLDSAIRFPGMPGWSADGTQAAFIQHTQEGDVLTIYTLTSGIWNEVYTGKRLYYPSWSPDGRMIASYAADGIHIVVLGDEPLAYSLTTLGDKEASPLWLPDSSGLVFLRIHADNTQQLMWGRADGGAWSALTTDVGIPITNLQWHPTLARRALRIGDRVDVSVTDLGLSQRDAPSINGELIQRLPNGTTVQIIDGPQEADGYVWWQVRTVDGVEGWSVEAADDMQTLVHAVHLPEAPVTLACVP